MVVVSQFYDKEIRANLVVAFSGIMYVNNAKKNSVTNILINRGYFFKVFYKSLPVIVLPMR